jgi:hypothetical protein
MSVAAGLSADRIETRIAHYLEKPRRKRVRFLKPIRLPRQCDKNGLCDILGDVPITNLSDSGTIDPIDVPPNEFGKCALRCVLRELVEKLLVGRRVHRLQQNNRVRAKRTQEPPNLPPLPPPDTPAFAAARKLGIDL